MLMKKIMLIGDSIRLSYQSKVAKLLSSTSTIVGPEDNCRFSAYTLFNISTWLLDETYDVIHWNNGQWDTCYMPDGKIHTSIDEYLRTQERIASILQKRSKRLIFALTTPVWPEMFQNGEIYPRRNEDIKKYNNALVGLLSNFDVEINDLYSPLEKDIKRYICDDMVHLSKDGVNLCAKLISNKLQSN
jgi:hypothetical protein